MTFRNLFPPRAGLPLEPIASRVPEMRRLQQSVSHAQGAAPGLCPQVFGDLSFW